MEEWKKIITDITLCCLACNCNLISRFAAEMGILHVTNHFSTLKHLVKNQFLIPQKLPSSSQDTPVLVNSGLQPF